MAVKNYIRKIKTTNERRQNIDTQGVTVRAKRKILPDSWFDFWCFSQRSWKKYRKTQYKLI